MAKLCFKLLYVLAAICDSGITAMRRPTVLKWCGPRYPLHWGYCKINYLVPAMVVLHLLSCRYFCLACKHPFPVPCLGDAPIMCPPYHLLKMVAEGATPDELREAASRPEVRALLNQVDSKHMGY